MFFFFVYKIPPKFTIYLSYGALFKFSLFYSNMDKIDRILDFSEKSA